MTILWYIFWWLALGFANAIYQYKYEPRTGNEEPVDLVFQFCFVTLMGALGVVINIVDKIFETRI